MAIDREAELRARFTGTVAGSFAVAVDSRGTTTCTVCSRTLGADDRVRAACLEYEGHTWELLDMACPDQLGEAVRETMGVRAAEQAVIEATLEPTGYHDPFGEFHPDVLTLGAVAILDHSPASAGYE
ncbi:hypothetical protein [Natronorarus salvus]|uniref:hypothetical protein n=1 Tax=Natronorarus salvus TaxID=3117733 RepID=UPI002F26221F